MHLNKIYMLLPSFGSLKSQQQKKQINTNSTPQGSNYFAL